MVGPPPPIVLATNKLLFMRLCLILTKYLDAREKKYAAVVLPPLVCQPSTMRTIHSYLKE
jgi:hypothetical protein